MRRPPQGKLNGEFIVSLAAPQQMLPAFATRHLPLGATGLVIVAILAAIIAPLVAGIHGLTTWLVVDLHRRFGWLNKTPGELRLARPLTLVTGLVVTVLASLLAQLASALPTILLFTAALGGPLLAVFLLGMLARRTTATAALMALALGVAIAVALALVRLPNLAEPWHLIFSFDATLLAGYLLSFLLGRRRTSTDLRGLVAGCGLLGLRASEEAKPFINTARVKNESETER